jgi:iron complex transport system substrate-binding protein
MSKSITIIVLALAMSMMLAVSPALGEKTTIKDDLGRDIVIDAPSERIVFMMENALKTYYAVGEPESIAALKDDVWMRKLIDDVFPVVDPDFEKKLTVKISGDAVNIESLANATPDLVVLWASSPEDPSLKAINETLNIPTFAIYVTSLDDIFHQVENMGEISGKQERATVVKGIMEDYVEKTTNITYEIPEDKRPTVYWMWSDVLGTAGVESGINGLIEEAGGANVMQLSDNDTRMMEHPVISLETLIKLNPNVIYMWYNEKLDPEDVMTSAEFEGWKEIDAVKNGRVYEIENPFLFDAFSPRLPLALLQVARDLHPEEFKGIDMNETIDQFHVDMWGVHYPSMEKA